MKIAVVTINYRNPEDTLEFVKSLNKAKLPEHSTFRLYLVDNDQVNNTLVDQLSKYPSVTYIKSKSNLGFAAGNNLGLRRALDDDPDLIAMVNNDTILTSNFFDSIIDSPVMDKNVGAVGGLIHFAKGFEFKKRYKQDQLGKVIWYAGGRIDWANILGSNSDVDEVDHGQYKTIFDTQFVTGALFITKPSVLKTVGLFDERYFMYFEDVDLSVRIQKAGFRTLVDPNIKIWHKVAQSSGIGSSLNDYFITRNRLLFGLKYASLRTQFALLREAIRKLKHGSDAQKLAIKDFFRLKFGKGSFL